MIAKLHHIIDKKAINQLFLRFFIKKTRFFLLFPKKVLPLHPQFRNCNLPLGYGVMVTLQILVLPFLVRIRVPQLKESPIAFKSGGWIFSLAKLSSNYRSDSENSNFQKKLGMQLLSQQLHPLSYYKIAIIGNSVAKLRNYSEFRNFQSMISINCLHHHLIYIIFDVAWWLKILGRDFCFDTS